MIKSFSPADFGRRLWINHSRLFRAARRRDQGVIEEQLAAHEGPIFEQSLKPPPEPEPLPHQQGPLARVPAHVTEIYGWEFVDHMRNLDRNPPVPRNLWHLWKAIDFEFEYDPADDDLNMLLTTDGVIRIVPRSKASPNDWLFYTWHLLFHLALGCLQPPDDIEYPDLWALAHEVFINHQVLQSIRIDLPQGFPALQTDASSQSSPGLRRFGGVRQNNFGPAARPDELVKQWQSEGLPENLQAWRSPAGAHCWDVVGDATPVTQHYHSLYTLAQVKSLNPQPIDRSFRYAETDVARAHRWFVDQFPLLSAAAADFDMDYESAASNNIGVAAVNAGAQIIYVNLAAGLTEMEWRFVIGHEILHVVLEHHRRLDERDPMVWNLACDYVINNWLIQMGVGVCPPKGGLYKKEYAGMDAETIYDELVRNDGNDQLSLESFRGDGIGDILDFDKDFPGNNNRRRRFFRPSPRQMTQTAARRMLEDEGNGLGRGHLPGDLVEELDLGSLLDECIRVPEWKVELAEWFRVQFMPRPPRRTYVRQSRRQAAAPEIPRPGKAALDYHSPTFGVVLDTSGSMSQDILQKGMAALVAFSERHNVTCVRLVMCDAAPYDEGFVPIERLKQSFRVWGRGGTVLQPAINLLENDKDFPEEAPILVITDGAIDVLTIRREHAFLLPGNGELPFEPQGPVFRILGENRGGRFGGRLRGRANNNGDNNGKRFSGFRPRNNGDDKPVRSPFRKVTEDEQMQAEHREEARRRTVGKLVQKLRELD